MINTGMMLIAAMAVSTPGAVKIDGWIGERFNRSLNGNVLKLDLEKDFFPPFEKREAKSGFIGLGKHADALVHYAKNTGDKRVIAEKEKAIGFLIDHQLPNGYTGFFCEAARLGELWDIHEMGFIIQALVADYELFGNEKALIAAKKNVDHILENWPKLPDNWEMTYITDRETMLGFGYSVARLYAVTKEERYREFLRHERALDVWNQPIVLGRGKMIYGQAYGYMGTCLEQLELYQYDPRQRYLECSLRALDFQTKRDGLLINGNGGIAECWTDDQDGEGSVGETCNATFSLLFWDELYRLGVVDRALLGDLMERCIYNGLFAAMSRDGRRLRYYTPLNGEREFWPDDLYCCPNNFRRGMSRLPEYIFYTEGRAVFANLYTACEATLDVEGEKVVIKEETDYPVSGKVKFTFDSPGKRTFAFNVRIPRWAKESVAYINGKKVTYIYKPGEMLSLPKVWKKGDTVELDFAMPVKPVLGRKRQSGRFAVMRGPLVYALNTRTIDVFKEKHPWDVQTMMMMDPKQLEYRDGKIKAVVSTAPMSVGVQDLSVDGEKIPRYIRIVDLVPYEDEDNTLTYFRAPDIKVVVAEDDLLINKCCK